MPLFRRTHADSEGTPAPEPAVEISREADLRTAIVDQVERRRSAAESFTVLCVTPQLTGMSPVSAAEAEASTRTISTQLRINDQFCMLDDGSYIVVLAETPEDDARVVARRIASELTLRSGGINQRKWLAGVAQYPGDARTEAALIALAQASATEPESDVA